MTYAATDKDASHEDDDDDEREGRRNGGELRLDRVATATNSLQDSQISKTISDCLRQKQLSLLKVTRLELELDLDSSRAEKERRVEGLKHCK